MAPFFPRRTPAFLALQPDAPVGGRLAPQQGRRRRHFPPSSRCSMASARSARRRQPRCWRRMQLVRTLALPWPGASGARLLARVGLNREGGRLQSARPGRRKGSQVSSRRGGRSMGGGQPGRGARLFGSESPILARPRPPVQIISPVELPPERTLLEEECPCSSE